MNYMGNIELHYCNFQCSLFAPLFASLFARYLPDICPIFQYGTIEIASYVCETGTLLLNSWRICAIGNDRRRTTPTPRVLHKQRNRLLPVIHQNRE